MLRQKKDRLHVQAQTGQVTGVYVLDSAMSFTWDRGFNRRIHAGVEDPPPGILAAAAAASFFNLRSSRRRAL